MSNFARHDDKANKGSDALVAGPWSPLRVRVYRALWIAALVSNVGTFMHIAAAGWAMTSLTDSPTLVGLVQTSWAVPGFLLALHSGAFADIIDRRNLITITQIAALLIAAALAVLVWADQLSVNSLLAGTFLESVALTLAAPAFMALTPQLVDAKILPQALGLDSVSRNIAQTVGPALAGVLIATFDPGAVFMLNAVSYVGIVIVVRRYRPAVTHAKRPTGVNRAIYEGLVHVAKSKSLRNIAVRLTLVMTGSAALMAMIPVVAKSSLGVSASGFGVMSGALGVGAVLAVWGLPALLSRLSIETVALWSALVWSGGTVIFANTNSLSVAVAALLVCGASGMGMMYVLFSSFMLQLPNLLRGRGSSLAMLMVWLGASVGAVGWGLASSAYGVGAALTATAAVNVAIAIVSRVALRVNG